MPKSIHHLDLETIDRIAAGEVLERPANLVKELVENSLDAGATEIEVDLASGGRTLRVRDNGSGIAKEDLARAFARHATSKITKADDLWSLASFGFRGEALASVAAVANATLVSRPAGQKEAARLTAKFGKLGSTEAVGGEAGTLLLIEDLFENIPARKKFLKSDSAEIAQAKRVLKAMALSHPQVTLRVMESGRLMQHWHAVPADPERSLSSRAQTVLDHAPFFQTRAQHGSIHVEIAFSSPQNTVGTSQNIWIFAQGRWIQDRSLQAAILEAYRTLLMHGEFPLCVVKVDVVPEDIDVNIHPAKSQVKFRDPQSVFRAVHHTLRAALEMAPWIPRPHSAIHSAANSATTFVATSDEATTQTQVEFSESTPSKKTASTIPNFASADQLKLKGENASEFDRVYFQKKLPSATKSDSTFDHPFQLGRTEFWSRLDVLGQSNLTYILAQSDSTLFLVDQHAAHERVMFETLSHQIRDGRVETQPFLVPLPLKLEPEMLEAILDSSAELSRMGVGIEQMGPETLVIHSSMSLIKESSLLRVIERLGREKLDHGGSFAFEKIINDLIATMACHSAIRAGQSLSVPEMKALLHQMDDFPLSSFCPHGRPVYIEFPFVRLDKEFGRIV